MKSILAFLGIVLFVQAIYSQNTTDQTPAVDRKYMLSIGGDFSVADGNGYGGNLKFDKILNLKSAIGLKTIAGLPLNLFMTIQLPH